MTNLRVGIQETNCKVFILVGSYLPGFKGGGPIRSTSNLVSALGTEFAFKVVTLDRDHCATSPYPGIPANQWVKTGNADVMYLSPGWGGVLKMIRLLRSVNQGAVLYLNSFYSRRFSMLPVLLKRVGLVRAGCLVVAPRGEFSPGALELKKSRKRIYISLAQFLGLYREVIWHASSPIEAEYICKWFKKAKAVRLAGVISEVHQSDDQTPLLVPDTAHDAGHLSGTTDESPKQSKRSGHLRVVFISRISPKKNLVGALSMLRAVAGEVAFHIYGPLEDLPYWEVCKAEIRLLPSNVQVQYCGEVEHNMVPGIIAGYDLVLLPTLGENFGHVICEALVVGCPVLISDRTPWRGLSDAGAGWDIPLDDWQEFRRTLQSCIDADHESYQQLRMGARKYARNYVANPEIISANRRLFQEAAAVARGYAK